jgi:hypothetical protein
VSKGSSDIVTFPHAAYGIFNLLKSFSYGVLLPSASRELASDRPKSLGSVHGGPSGLLVVFCGTYDISRDPGNGSYKDDRTRLAGDVSNRPDSRPLAFAYPVNGTALWLTLMSTRAGGDNP